MLEGNLPVEQQQAEEVKTLHPYTPNQERPICDINDTECLHRLVAAFSDCD